MFKSDVARQRETAVGTVSQSTHHLYPSILTSGMVLLVYWLTLAPDLTWSHFGIDGGELITAAVTLGIPHPPGYPTYILLGKLFSWLPLGTVAYRFNLFSAVTVAGAAGLVTGISYQLTVKNKSLGTGHFWSAVASGLSLAFTSLIWGQAIITEVYGLNLLLLAAFFWALLGERPSPIIGFLLGLSITTHLTSIFMIPLAFGLTRRNHWPRLGIGVVSGLTPFLLLPWLAQGNSPVIWGEPISISGWWWLVSGRLYHANLFSSSPAELMKRAAEWTLLLARQYTWAGLPLIALTFFYPEDQNLRVRLSLLGTTFIYILYALNYGTNDAVVLLLPVNLLLSFLLSSSLRQMGRFALLLPAALLLLNFHMVNLSGEQFIRANASAMLREAPQNAILLTPGDQTIFTLWYFQHVEGQRSDLVLIDANLTAFDWYRKRLAERYPDVQGLVADDVPALRQMNRGKRPFCMAYLESNAQQSLDCH